MTRLFLLSMVVVLVLSGVLLKACSEIKKLNAEVENTTQAYENANTEVERIQNKYKQEVAIRKQVQVDKNQFEKLMHGKVDSLANLAGVREKRIAEYSTVISKLKRENLELLLQPADTVYSTDSLTGDISYYISKPFYYSEEYFSIGGSVLDCMKLKFDSIIMEAPLDIFVTWQKKKLKLFGKRRKWLPRWGPKEYEKRVTSPNPHLRIEDIQTFKILKR